MGSVLNHPVYDNGDVITTSALTQTTNLEEGDTVTTYSGSQYVLGRRLDGWQKVLGSIAEEATATAGVELPSVELPSVANLNVGDSMKSPSSSSSSSMDDDAASTRDTSSQAETQKSGSPPSVPASSAPAKNSSQLQIEPKFRGKKNSNSSTMNGEKSASAAPAPTLRQRRRDATRRYNLTGQTAGRKRSGGSNYEYLISGRPFRTTSGKSKIYTAYMSNDDGLPMTTMGEGDRNQRRSGRSTEAEAEAKAVAMMVSTNCEALKRENANYDRIIAGGCGDRFVKKYEFIDKWGGPQFSQSACALVIEAGQQDLKERHVRQRRKGGRWTGWASHARCCPCRRSMRRGHAQSGSRVDRHQT